MKKLKVVRDIITERPDGDGECIPIRGITQDYFFMANAHLNGVSFAHYKGHLVRTAEVKEERDGHGLSPLGE